MARHSPDRSVSSNRSQQPSKNQSTAASRSRRSNHQDASLKAKFSANITYLRLTVFIILTVALVLSLIAFFSSNWLEVEKRYYGSKFRKLGLWRMCFNSFSAPDDLQFRKFYVGCRWIFADEYKPIRRYLLPGRLNNNSLDYLDQ